MQNSEPAADGSPLADTDISYAQFRALANSIPNLAWMANPDGWVFWYNQRWYEYTGTTPEEMVGWGWQSVHDPELLPDMLSNWTASLSNGEPFEMTFPLRRGADGSFRMFVTRAEPLKEGGRIVGWFGTNTDITELERTKERLQLVVNELNHRVKNTLVTVQSIAAQSFKHSDPADYLTFERRLLSLSRVHNLLTHSGWSNAEVSEIVSISAKMFGEDRFEITGDVIVVDPGLATSLAMTLHELCTNAMKYGALSNSLGRVIVKWSTESVGERKFMHFSWNEVDGPPVVTPTRTGFGLKLITRATTSGQGARVDHSFEPGGVRCDVRVPIDQGFLR
jgi:PAS domain S-box-containing protein